MTSLNPAGPALDRREGAQRRQLTVMFCDLVGSTPLAGRLDPEDFSEVLGLYQELAGEAIGRYDGYIAQFLGDGVVACFGYPRAHEDDAHRGVYAGLAILEGLAELNARLRRRFGTELDVRIGCHTGLVVAGAADSGPARDEFSMVGETPHIAARLQGVAAPGSLVVSDVTRELIHGYFETEPLGEKTLAGVSAPVAVHRVMRSIALEDRLGSTARERLTPLVDRGEEMRLMLAAWEEVNRGRGAVVRISGEPGIGKSRLAHALVERLGDGVASVQRWQCSRHHQTTALHPVMRMLESKCGIERGEPEDAQLEKLRGAVLAAALDPGDAVPLLADLLPVLAGRLGRERPADPQEERTLRLRTLESLLVLDPAQHPMVLVVEDLQWADPTTLELLWRVLGDLSEVPVLCLATYRPEFAWPWSRQPGAHIEVGPLAPEQVRELAEEVTGATLDEEAVGRVCAAAGGIPLFVEEMMKAPELYGSGPADANVPATLQGLLTERLDRLPELGGVLDVAAVLGREFDRGLLEALDPLTGGDLTPALGKLAAEDVLRPLDGSPARYEFKHALLHEAAYSRILRRRRQQLHAQVASTLVGRFAELAEHEPELVAHHWSCAAAPDEAARYWRVAGVRALERAAFVEAADHFRRGLEALERAEPGAETEDRRADFLTHLGAAVQAGTGYAAAGVGEAYERARARWEKNGDAERLSAVIRGQWMLHLVAADYDGANELATEVLEIAAQRGSAPALAEGHLYAGMVHMYRAELERAREHLEQAIRTDRRPEHVDQVYEAQGDTTTGAHAYLAIVMANLGDEKASRQHSDRSLELAELVDRPVTRAQAWFMRAILHLGYAEPAGFGEWVEKVRAYSVDRNIRYWRTLASAYSNWGRGMAGDHQVGIERLQSSIESYLKSGARLGLVHLYALLADLQLAAAAPGAALETITLAEQHMERSGERLIEPELLRGKARALAAGPRPDFAAAITELQRAAETAKRQGARLSQLRALGQLVAHRRRAGEDASAEEQRLAAACEWFPRDSELPDLQRARALVRPVANL